MKIYTKTGDAGETGLFAGSRVAKDDPRIEAYGTVDELNAVLGLARSSPLPQEIDVLIARIQHQLFELGAVLATPNPAKQGNRISDAQIRSLEEAIDHFEKTLSPLKQFILPGGASSAAALHVARAVCRRAERRVVTLRRKEENSVPAATVVYLNRLGDLLFVLARAANQLNGVPDIPWEKEGAS